MKITFLGTNGWYDTAIGNTPSVFIETKSDYIILDAGFGFYKAKELIKSEKPVSLFISHFHLDHIIGLHTLPLFKLFQGIDIYLPSGAISGLDGLKSAMMAKVKSATLTTRKPTAGLKGAPYIKEKNIDLDSIKKETVIFEGTAEDAVKGFPQNVNVSATLSMCGLGPKNTKVRIVTSPDYTSNTHEVEIEGDFGRLKTVTENVPMPTNPKTSYLAALSAIAVLSDIISSSRIGN